MAGHVIALYLREKGHDVTTLSAHNKLDEQTILIDVTDTVKLAETLHEKHYDAVINCIGMLVKQSEERKDLASYLNAFLPHYLENYYKNSSTRVIHLSTDCVFSGNNAPYSEESPYDGEIFYDRSKALGEIKNSKDLTFRMSIIGPDMTVEGIGLFNWFHKQTGTISGYEKAMWNGITTIELARGIDAALKQNLTGLYHLVPSKNISKYNLLKIIKTIFARDDITITPNDDLVQDKTLVNTRTDFDFAVSDYTTLVEEMEEWIIAHQDIYKHYERGTNE